jgi:hypothetical protein
MSNSPFQNPFYRALLLIVALLCFVAVPVGLSTELNRLSDARASRSWPTVAGTIRTARVEQVLGRKSRETAYFPRVEFSYSVAGQTYQGDRLSAHGSASDVYPKAKVTIDRYPVGSEHRVYYDPANPTSSLLEPGMSRQPAAPFVLIAVFFGIGLTVLGLWYKTLPARKWRSN